MTALDGLSAEELVARILAADAAVPALVAAEQARIAALAEAAAWRIRRGGRVRYVGAGTSGRLAALDAAEIPPTFGVAASLVSAALAGGAAAFHAAREGAEDDAAQGATDLRQWQVTPADLVIGIAASGTTPYVLGALAEARRVGALVAAITTSRDTPLERLADLAIVVPVGDEVLRGSTRMKAGTAQKLVLHSFSTTLFVLLGHVFGDVMIDVQPTNHKLRARAREIVATIAGVGAATAEAALLAAGMRIRPAVLMARDGIDCAAAEERLRRTDGDLRRALET
ncbi:MAG: N-acetylmuramic acid 6-phosphate etherase [Chloroflexi bacterium]|nr:N-acetylmuramic acid 6-phosphate etherase [Chloroflexota bacterium]